VRSPIRPEPFTFLDGKLQKTETPNEVAYRFAFRPTAPGDVPINRLNARLNAPSDS
jgi:hypothetical protein